MRIAKILIYHGAELETKTKDSNDCLYFARQNESKEFETLILSKLAKR